jgi:hypothetical protein
MSNCCCDWSAPAVMRGDTDPARGPPGARLFDARSNAGAAADDVEDVFDGILRNFSDRRWGDLVDLRHCGPHIHADVAPDANGWLLSYDVNSAALSGRLGDASLYWPRGT